MLYTLYRGEISPRTAYKLSPFQLQSKFIYWQQKHVPKIKLRSPAAKVLFFIGCEHGLQSVVEPKEFRNILTQLKTHA